jgi:hypothetical protein
VAWQWYPSIDGLAFAGADPSTRAEYYAPLLQELGTQSGPIGRIEVTPLTRHWESVYLGADELLARGWERQVDVAFNPLFYDGGLNATTYKAWLADNGVAFVALPDAPVDFAATQEKALLDRRLLYLHEIWHNAHWKLWRVDGFHGLVDGPATLTQLTADHMRLDVQRPGVIDVRVRASGQWSVPDGGCATATAAGWTELHLTQPGDVTISQSLRGTLCPSP